MPIARVIGKIMAVLSYIFMINKQKNDLLYDLCRSSMIPRLILQLFYALCKEGNKARNGVKNIQS